MTVGYLHLGPPESGPARSGILSARFVAEHTDWDVREVAVAPGGGRPRAWELVSGARRLAGVGVVHAQYAPAVWGGRPWQLGPVLAFAAAVRGPLVTTVHDVLPGNPLSTRLALAWLAARSACVLVSTDAERAVLLDRGVRAPVEVVPLFVERRGPLPPREEAKAALGLSGRRVATVLGYIHPGKGPDLAVEALARTGEDTVLVLAGGPVRNGGDYVDRLRDQVRERGLESRVRITGFLTDAEQDSYMAATDVGLLPFRHVAASASLTTWLATGRPLVASDLPSLREYADQAPALIRLVPPGDPAALAEAVAATTPTPAAEAQAAELADRFSPRRTAARLADVYVRYAGRSHGRAGPERADG